LLDAALAMARRCDLDQLIVTLGAASDEVRAEVDLVGIDVVESAHHREGCSASICAAIAAVDARAGGIVLLLGDQPGIAPASVLAVAESGAPIAVGRYADGIGHPFWFGRP
jgi:molybdenum cofactor cytidylyltransferase